MRRLLFFLFVCLACFLVYSLWVSRYRIVDFNLDDLSSVDLYVMPDQQVVHIDNKREVQRIGKKILKCSGHKKDLQLQTGGQVRFIHLYLDQKDTIEVSQTGDQIAVNGKWYKVRKIDLYRMDKIFSAYFN